MLLERFSRDSPENVLDKRRNTWVADLRRLYMSRLGSSTSSPDAAVNSANRADFSSPFSIRNT